MLDDGYRIEEPTEYEAACEFRRELEPRAAIVEREEVRRTFVRAIDAAQRRIARRQAIAAKSGHVCDVEGCCGDLENPDSCCDACLLQYYIEVQAAAAEPMQSPWHTADSRYFANQIDAQLQQRWLSERRQRHVDRIAGYVRRRGAWTDQAEQHFVEARFTITPDGERALREAELIDQANADVERARRTVGRMFDAVTSILTPTHTGPETG